MKTLLHLTACALALLSLAACSDSGEYVNRDGTICYSHWTFSFGRLYDTLPGVDPASFKPVNDWLGHDRNAAFFKNQRVEGVHIGTLEADRYPLFRDKNDYYYRNRPLHVADMASFKVLKWNDDDMWAADRKYAYYDSLRIEADMPTFKVKTWNIAVDRNHVYRFGKPLPLADPATYDDDWKHLYSRDKKHIWYLGELVEDADYATFTVDEDGNARDARGPFRGAQRDTTLNHHH